MFPKILDTNFLLLINLFYSEHILWKVRMKYYNFNQIFHLLILFATSMKLLVILFIIKFYARNNILKNKKISNKKRIKSRAISKMKLQTHLRYFLGSNVFGDDALQNIFAYQSTATNTLELKKARALIMFLIRNQKGIYF